MNSDTGEAMNDLHHNSKRSIQRTLFIIILVSIGAILITTYGGARASQQSAVVVPTANLVISATTSRPASPDPSLDIATMTTMVVAAGTTTNATATVPAGWVPRTYQVINGVIVPPEPDPTTNNSTLAGVDINKNGVRDDVERNIARKITDTTKLLPAIKYAAAYQAIAINPVPTTRNGALQALKNIMCSQGAGRSVAEIAPLLKSSGIDVESLTFNTDFRKQKLASVYAMLGGGYDGEELVCE